MFIAIQLVFDYLRTYKKNQAWDRSSLKEKLYEALNGHAHINFYMCVYMSRCDRTSFGILMDICSLVIWSLAYSINSHVWLWSLSMLPINPTIYEKITWSLASKNSKLFKTRVQQCDYWPQHCGFWFLGVGQPLILSCTVRCILVQTFFSCQTIISMWDLGEYHTIQDCHMATF